MKFLAISLNDFSKFLTKLPSHPLSLGTLKLKSNEILNFLSFHPFTLPSCTLPPSLQLQSLHQGPFFLRSLDVLAFWFFGGLISSLFSVTTKALLLAPSPYTMKWRRVSWPLQNRINTSSIKHMALLLISTSTQFLLFFFKSPKRNFLLSVSPFLYNWILFPPFYQYVSN